MPNKIANLTAERMHRAVDARDAAFDGRFVFGVVTTGVYCRPACPARPALPENRRFFCDAHTATAAGFRPCKRCKPDQPGHDVDRIAALARYIENNASETLSLAHLAQRAGLSPGHFQKAFKKALGVSPKAYQDAARQRRLKHGLRSGDDVTSAIYNAGFGSTSRVYDGKAGNIGMTPSAYRHGGAGETISYACRNTSLGPMMMAATDRGVCFVMFGDDEAALKEALEAEFPRATRIPAANAGGAALDDWMTALDAHLASRAPRPDLPLDLRGTAFQIAVWRFLLSIPEGSVVSYGELAAGIEKPRAVRAAASACAANRVAVLVPCHRVLRGDGGLGGYRWGVERKRSLLDAERRVCASQGERSHSKT